jgi:hypothetical protein
MVVVIGAAETDFHVATKNSVASVIDTKPAIPALKSCGTNSPLYRCFRDTPIPEFSHELARVGRRPDR